MTASINTIELSNKLREKSIRTDDRQILISRLSDSEQERDITQPVNCEGFGRVRHFRLETSDGWQPNTLPIEPACKTLNLPSQDVLRAQVFQNAACNWRCWYCYVPFALLAADERRAGWLAAADMVDLYLKENDRPCVIDLSGGQPDLVPEWIPWMMTELKEREIEQEIYLWSDDNLSNNFFWKYLSTKQRELVRDYRNYGKVCCFKGFDDESFSFNTSAEQELFAQQFSLMKSYVDFGLDVYGYVTFTTPNKSTVHSAIPKFVDQLQLIHASLPLRIIPLEIKEYFTMAGRTKDVHELAMKHQQLANEIWNREIENRFSPREISQAICDVDIGANVDVH